MDKPIYIRKYVFLEIIENTFSDKSTDYLIALKDALNILILQREVGCYKPYDKYFVGLLKI